MCLTFVAEKNPLLIDSESLSKMLDRLDCMHDNVELQLLSVLSVLINSKEYVLQDQEASLKRIAAVLAE